MKKIEIIEINPAFMYLVILPEGTSEQDRAAMSKELHDWQNRFQNGVDTFLVMVKGSEPLELFVKRLEK